MHSDSAYISRRAPSGAGRAGPALRRARRLRSVALVALATAAAVLASPPVARSDREDGGGSDAPRFELTRTASYLFRIDTATGQVWAVPVSGEGGWQAMGEPPDGAAAPGRSGRFRLVTIASNRRGLGGGAGSAQLLRTDRSTGRAWLAPAEAGGQWSPIDDPQPPAP